MSNAETVDVVLRFADAINTRDLQAIMALMTSDHRFVDSLGAEITGREKVRQAWTAYFRIVPDYRIEVRESFRDGDIVVLLGVAKGTYTSNGTLAAENAWETPAAWRARVRGNKVAEWQVYADNEPMRRKMGQIVSL